MATHSTSRTMLRRAPSVLTSRRAFTSSATRSINPLMNLAAFSGSKEAEYLSKERKIPRVEFSPYLELIRSSEVDPFAPAPGASPTVVSALNKAKRGQADMQTAYSLAVTNLIQHLEVSRVEAKHATSAYNALYARYKTQERQAFLAMLTTVTLLAILIIQPDFIFDSRRHVGNAVDQWKGYDWQWLGNPPPHRLPKKESVHETPTPRRNQELVVTPVEVMSDKAVQTEPERHQPTIEFKKQPSLLSRVFWKSTAN